MMRYLKLPRTYFARATHVVAKELLGKLLVRHWRGKKFIARVNEVESYVGEDDLACHARSGRTKRTEIMYGEAGHAYVFLIYGMYHCLNVVTEQEGYPAAVLIRGATLVPKPTPFPSLVSEGFLNGPGKLTRALKITLAQNGVDLVNSPKLFIADDGFNVAKKDILATPRIGVNYAGKHAALPWRYLIQNAPRDSFASL